MDRLSADRRRVARTCCARIVQAVVGIASGIGTVATLARLMQTYRLYLSA